MARPVGRPRGSTAAVADAEAQVTEDELKAVAGEGEKADINLDDLPSFDDSPASQAEFVSATGTLIGDGLPTVEIKEKPVKVKITVKNFLNADFVAKVKIIRRGNVESFESFVREAGGRIEKDLLEEEVTLAADRYSKDVWDLIWLKMSDQVSKWYADQESFSLCDVYEFIASTFPALGLDRSRNTLRQQWMSLIEWQRRDGNKRGNALELIDLVKLWLKMNGVVFSLK